MSHDCFFFFLKTTKQRANDSRDGILGMSARGDQSIGEHLILVIMSSSCSLGPKWKYPRTFGLVGVYL